MHVTGGCARPKGRHLLALFGKKDTELQAEELSREISVDHYVAMREKGARKRLWGGIAVALLAVVAIAAAIGMAYLQDINTRLSSGVSETLKQTLTTTEVGEPFYMLLLGVDKNHDRINDPEYGAEDSAYRSDSIMLARIDPTAKKVTLVSIHRDTLVNLGEHGTEKINAAYSLGGPTYAVKVVEEFAGVPISHYAEVDFDSFCMIVDSIGGIEVDVPVDVYDPQWTGADIKAGVQIVNGDQALQLCRARHAYDEYGDGDLYRAANQRMVIAAIVKKVIQQDPATMAGTVGQLADSVTTDLSVTDIIDLAGMMRGIDTTSDIYSGMNPTTSQFVNETWYEICDVAEWQRMMSRVAKGLPPYETIEDDPTTGVAGNVGWEAGGIAVSGEDAVTDEDVLDTVAPEYEGSVLVLNAAGVYGLAGRISQSLSSYGFTCDKGDAEEMDHTDTLVVYNGDEAMAQAKAVSEALGGQLEIVANDGSYPSYYDVVVILGTDVA